MTPHDAGTVAPPVFTGVLLDDADLLADRAAETERVLAALPARPERDEEQRRAADEAIGAARRARATFLRAHAEQVYRHLTAGLREHPRLAELVFAAADAFPGLVPTRAQLAAESGLAQSAKDGREIDQGLFFQAVFASPAAGRHLLRSMLRPTERARMLAGRFARSGCLELEKVRLERVGGAAHVTMCNGAVLNAEDCGLVDDMETAVDIALLDDRVEVGVVRGDTMTHPRYRGRRVFCAGINLSDLHQGRISYVDFLLRRETGYLSKLIRGLLLDDGWPRAAVEKPWIAAVDTFAIGGGMQVLFAVDHVIAAADSYFSLPAAQEGIVPGVGNLRLTAQAGPRLARQVILSGRKIWAHEPQAAAVCDEVVDPKAMDAAIEAATARLTGPAVAVNRHMINVAAEPLDHFRDYLAEFALAQAQRLYSEDVIAKVGRFTAGTARAGAGAGTDGAAGGPSGGGPGDRPAGSGA
jgi:thioesterase DpgC